MSRPTGDDENSLHRILETIRTASILLLVISLLGANGKKSPDHTARTGIGLPLAGCVLFFGSGLLRDARVFYIVLCSAGWLLILYGGNYLSRVIWNRAATDIFNRLHESFPQEQRLLQNPRSVNLPAQYQFNGALLESWVNFVSPSRGTASGKAWLSSNDHTVLGAYSFGSSLFNL
jgi:hypothetical protein